MRTALLTLVLAVGCTTDPDRCEGLSAALGEGEFAYEARTDGDSITLVHGPQGGWHVDLAGEVSGSSGHVTLTPSIIGAEQQISIAGLGQEDEGPFALSGWSRGTCTGTFHRLRAVIDDVERGGSYLRFICTLADHPFDVSVAIRDEGTGETVSAGFAGIAALDAADVDFCASL